ncbi:hypothetical protein FY044_18205 [Leclercia adecarboxylata]|nr:hypothetical protein FY044_18205 [Leclercia adecarboxylata]
MFAGKKSAQIREILISESAWEEMTCLFAPSLGSIKLSFNKYIIRKTTFNCFALSLTKYKAAMSEK